MNSSFKTSTSWTPPDAKPRRPSARHPVRDLRHRRTVRAGHRRNRTHAPRPRRHRRPRRRSPGAGQHSNPALLRTPWPAARARASEMHFSISRLAANNPLTGFCHNAIGQFNVVCDMQSCRTRCRGFSTSRLCIGWPPGDDRGSFRLFLRKTGSLAIETPRLPGRSAVCFAA